MGILETIQVGLEILATLGGITVHGMEIYRLARRIETDSKEEEGNNPP